MRVVAGGAGQGRASSGVEQAGAHYSAVARAIRAFRESRTPTLSLSDLAAVVGLSRFHFNRVFHRVVGIPPGQFQSLLRLDAARRLLLTTSRSIIDVSLDVGYESLGTFTRRFTQTLGLPPQRLRRAARRVSRAAPQPSAPTVAPYPGDGVIQGMLTGPSGFERGVILIGLFRSPVPQGRPERCCVLAEPGPFSFTGVADGVYYLMAAAFDEDAGLAQRLLHDNILRAAATQSPLIVRDGDVVSGAVDLELRGPHAFDPPILTALLPLLADPERPLPRKPAIREKTATRPPFPNTHARQAACGTYDQPSGESPAADAKRLLKEKANAKAQGHQR